MAVTEKTLEAAALKAIKKMRQISPKRNFVESVEVQISLKGIDLRRPENRFRIKVKLPHPVSDKDKIAVFADDPHIPPLKPLEEKGEVIIIDKAKIEELSTNKRAIKKLARRIRMFVASATLMSLIGRYFGRYLSPRNKMPIPVGITSNIVDAVNEAKRTVAASLQKSPTVHAKIGNIKMKDEELAENVAAFVMAIKNKMPKGWQNIRRVFVKTTMGPPVEVEIMKKKK